ncbi:Gfo/Idh/MocA family protein [Cytobacillus firmus]|uniref:Oxidoreductase domain-containing protein n=1 Tax=Cytobacillus firmus DS1 TaxID=1307436 RepID=W7L7A5_CYTFI|nr:Gfo/Idh/MocA family oxidoreductase [Cytobacillus firmus]EWG11137.1 oxidoreductase domain-containing protein [Cytobacillus firmus DS1]
MVRFGIVGTNWITERFLKAALQAEDFQLTAVYSRTEEKAKEFAGKYGVERTFTDLHTMAESGEIDAVYIASPNSLHAEQAVIFMENKVHVLCEKPIASNAKELQTMITAARDNNVLLMEALKSTLMPNFLAVKENLHKIGQVRRYFASYCQYSSRYDAYRQGTVLNAFNPEFSNGSIMDIGIYCIYPMVALFGKPEEIKAAGYKLESGVDGEGSIVLKYPDMDAVIMYSKITNSSLPAEIQGEEGNIVIDKISTPEKVELHYRNGEKEDLTQDQLSDSMYYEAKEFIRLVQAGKTESDINSFANSMITMEIIEEARRQIGVVYPADRN